MKGGVVEDEALYTATGIEEEELQQEPGSRTVNEKEVRESTGSERDRAEISDSNEGGQAHRSDRGKGTDTQHSIGSEGGGARGSCGCEGCSTE